MSTSLRKLQKNLDLNALLLRSMQKKFQIKNGKYLHMVEEIKLVSMQ